MATMKGSGHYQDPEYQFKFWVPLKKNDPLLLVAILGGNVKPWNGYGGWKQGDIVEWSGGYYLRNY